jgi:hypothetical protein
MGNFLAEESHRRLMYTYNINEDDFSMKLDSDSFMCVYSMHVNKTLTLPVIYVYFFFFVFNGGRTFNDKRSVQSDNLK